MKSRKELLQILFDNIDMFQFGLCRLISDLLYCGKLTHDEYSRLRGYIGKNPPLKTYHNSDYYWKPGNVKPRINWLKKHIKLNS